MVALVENRRKGARTDEPIEANAAEAQREGGELGPLQAIHQENSLAAPRDQPQRPRPEMTARDEDTPEKPTGRQVNAPRGP